jgi:AraC-like DNA-binding protein
MSTGGHSGFRDDGSIQERDTSTRDRSGLARRHAGPDVTLFASDVVRIGQFRCPVGHPSFDDSGPTQTYCFVFPRTSVWIQHDGAGPFVADPNVVPFYNRARPYRRRAISPQGDRTDWFGVAPELLRDALAQHDPDAADDPDRLFRFGFGPATSRTYAWQRAVFDHVVSHDMPDSLLVEESVVGLLDDVLGNAYRRPPCPKARCRHLEIVERVREYLATTFAQPVQLPGIARAAGVSVFHLCRVFKASSGWTLHQYRNQLRLRASLELLGESDDILAVAIELGYSSHSHFTAAFRAAFDLSPSQWRAQSSRTRARLTGRACQG